MKNNSDFGENTAVVLALGVVVGMPLLFTAWLMKQALGLALPPASTAPTPAALTATEWTRRSISENVCIRVERGLWK